MKKILLLVMALASCSTLFAAPEIDKPAPDFTLQDSYGKTHSLKDYAGKVVVLEWTNYDCPFTKKFYDSGTMQLMQKEFTSQGVVWLSICSSAPGKQGNFTSDQINQRAQKLGARFTVYLIDEKGDVGRLYDVKTTPTAYVIDTKGNLAYMGAIDDTPSTDQADLAKAHNLVRPAIRDVLAGVPVAIPTSKPYGCSIKY